jgi:hypothetical protein
MPEASRAVSRLLEIPAIEDKDRVEKITVEENFRKIDRWLNMQCSSFIH